MGDQEMTGGTDQRLAFVEFAVATGVLQFGEYVLKSGRTSPYFFNAGLFNTGARLATLGRFYADAIANASVGFDVLMGPAYKGIPIASATAVALSDEHQRNVPWCFNRKEVKDHGEGGLVVGAELAGRVLVVDDVITAGTAIGEIHSVITDAGAQLAGVVVALDRQERGSTELSATQQVAQMYRAEVIAISTLDDIVAFLEQCRPYRQHLSALREYRETYAA